MNEHIENESFSQDQHQEPEALHDLRIKRKELVASRQKCKVTFHCALGLGWIVPSLFFIFFIFSIKFQDLYEKIGPFIVAGVISLVVIAILAAASFRSQERSITADIQDLDFEIEMQKLEVLSRERRAEKIVHMSNLQLRRYYDLNLSQNIWVFGLGVSCIAGGLGIIGTALYFILKSGAESEVNNIIIAVLSSVGAILVNYVAAIFLKIHGAAAVNLSSFHSRLVETNQLLMGNLLASRIEDNKTRWQTLSRLALHITGQKGHREDD